MSTQKADGKKSMNYADSYRQINPNSAKHVKACIFQFYKTQFQWIFFLLKRLYLLSQKLNPETQS